MIKKFNLKKNNVREFYLKRSHNLSRVEYFIKIIFILLYFFLTKKKDTRIFLIGNVICRIGFFFFNKNTHFIFLEYPKFFFYYYDRYIFKKIKNLYLTSKERIKLISKNYGIDKFKIHLFQSYQKLPQRITCHQVWVLRKVCSFHSSSICTQWIEWHGFRTHSNVDICWSFPIYTYL